MKKYIVYPLLCALAVGLTSCPRAADNVDASFYFCVESSDGVDLLDRENPDAYVSDSINIYYVTPDGETHLFYDKNHGTPKGFSIVSENDYRNMFGLNLCLEMNRKGFFFEDWPSTTTTLIRWNSTDTDTLTATFRKGSSYYLKQKVWYNGVLVYDDDNPVYPIIIVK